ncbi:MAG TPA: DUF3040 domain-containing protein [Marmoricola sp.]|nr:DUF3040 domain-containing protein [Marmoricola sp.]
MPLSEEENRLLAQMERALAAEDPKFVSTLRGRTLERNARLRAIAAGVVFLAGIALLMGGVIAQLTWLGIVGFLVMLGSATLGLAAWRGRHAPREAAAPGESPAHEGGPGSGHGFRVVEGGKAHRPRRQRGRRPRGSFMQRMEQRWQHRREQGF